MGASLHYRAGAFELATSNLPDEAPVALEYNGISHAVMLATPADLDDFALGFSLSEGIVDEPGQVYEIDRSAAPEGITVHLRIANAAFARLKERRRSLAGRTGCGLCGVESLEQVLRPAPALAGRGPKVAALAIGRALDGLARGQSLRKITGAVHGAAWCRPDGGVDLVREDVGRHNALDKLIGAVSGGGRPVRPGFVAVTSRASVEMVQKAARISALLVAVSSPTAMAARLARDIGLTLVGVARGSEFSVFSHGWRIEGCAGPDA